MERQCLPVPIHCSNFRRKCQSGHVSESDIELCGTNVVEFETCVAVRATRVGFEGVIINGSFCFIIVFVEAGIEDLG